MSKRGISFFAAAMMIVAPALAQADEETEAWIASASEIRAPAAGLTLPMTVAGLSLSKSGEASNGGKGIDNVAQYLSEDGAVQATLYVYLPSYADTSIAAYMTDKAITERFGAKTRRTAYASIPVAGRAASAIRAVYDDAADGALTTAAAFAQVGRWMVKLRVTGPTEQRRAVLAGMDGMLAALRVDDPAALHPAAPPRFAACPAADGADARLTDMQPATPADNASASLCLRGTVQTAEGRYDILQQAGRADGSVLVPIDDSGTTLAFDRAKDGGGYQLSIHSIGQTDLYGVYDRVPNNRQIAAIIDGKDPQTAQAGATAAYAANGEVTMLRAAAQGR